MLYTGIFQEWGIGTDWLSLPNRLVDSVLPLGGFQIEYRVRSDPNAEWFVSLFSWTFLIRIQCDFFPYFHRLCGYIKRGLPLFIISL